MKLFNSFLFGLMGTFFGLFFAMNVAAYGHEHKTVVRGVSFAVDVIQRMPDEALVENLTCGNDPSEVVLDASERGSVYLWNRLENRSRRTIVHHWQHQANGIWNSRAEVDLSIGASGGWRSWSSKSIDANSDLGNWRVVIAPKDEPEDVLCTVSLTVVQ